MGCGSCLSYWADDMAVDVFSKEIGVASRRTIIRHVVQIEGFKKPSVHFITCYHELRKRGLQCCFPDSTPVDGPHISLKCRISKEREVDREGRSGDVLVGVHLFLQGLISGEFRGSASRDSYQ